MALSRTRLVTRLSRRCGWLLAAGSLLVLVGCGGSDGPQRYHLSGTVTYGGKPVPAGTVSFLPDQSQGNRGPGGSAPIKDGKFDTAGEGIGHVGGPHVVSVTGMDGVAIPDMPMGRSLFPDYEAKMDLPKQDSTQNIEVPAEGQGRR